jgi:hypothetical protein
MSDMRLNWHTRAATRHNGTFAFELGYWHDGTGKATKKEIGTRKGDEAMTMKRKFDHLRSI